MKSKKRIPHIVISSVARNLGFERRFLLAEFILSVPKDSSK